MKEKIILAILISSLLFPSVFAAVSCPNCRVNNCQCSISDCANGFIDIFSSATCSGNPLYEYSFAGGALPWYPSTAGTYYMLALCDGSHIYSVCSQIPVTGLVTSTSTSTSSTTTTSSTIQPSPGNNNIVLYVLVIVIIAVVVFIAFRLFSKKKPKVDYESLYRKWGR